MDGTIIDSRQDLTDAVNCALESIGHKKQTLVQIVPHVGNGLRTLISQVAGPVSEQELKTAIAAFSEFYDEHCVDKTTAYNGVIEVLKDLHGKVKLGVVTNKPLHFSQRILDALNLSSYFATVVGGDSTPEKKPHPAPVIKALSELRAEAKNSLMLGDGPQDVLAAQGAGVKSCVAGYGYGFVEKTMQLKPDFRIDKFIDLKEIVL